MAQPKPARKRLLNGKITCTCTRRGTALAAGAVACATCLAPAGPAHAAPRPSPVVKVTSVPTIEPLHYVPFAEMREPGWPVPAPIGRLDDHDRPEPDTTFYEPGIFAAGTAIASTTPRVRQGGLG
jgi:hypothetical protein